MLARLFQRAAPTRTVTASTDMSQKDAAKGDSQDLMSSLSHQSTRPHGTELEEIQLTNPQSTGSEHMGSILPPPVTSAVSYKTRKKARMGSAAPMRVHWAKFKRRLGPGTSPSNSSVVGTSATGTENYHHHSKEHGHMPDEANAVIVGGPVDFPGLRKPGTNSEHAQTDYSGGVGERSVDMESLSAAPEWSIPGEMIRWTG